MRILIVEDELPAAERLIKSILHYNSAFSTPMVLQTVADSVTWLNNNPSPDLIFMDIALSDGQSFAIFDRCKIDCPVIFTTAFDEYWQSAFEHNCIDYLLKPISQPKLVNALMKYERLKKHFTGHWQTILKQWQEKHPLKDYRKRFLVKRGLDLLTIKTEDIAYCYAAHKIVFLITSQGSKYVLDKSLQEISSELDPALFFRVNRKYLVGMQCIQRIVTTQKGKLQLFLQPATADEIMIANENTLAFKQWLVH